MDNPTQFQFLFDLLLKLGDWINTITNFQLVVTLAILGWIISTKELWSKRKRIVLIIGFSIFAIFSISSLYETLKRLNTVRTELKTFILTTNDIKFYTHEFKMLILDNPDNSWMILCFCIIDFLLILTIWLSDFLKKHK